MRSIVVIATKGDRKEQLKRTVDSLYRQAEVIVYDNSINQDLTDNAKFIYVDAFNQPVYYHSCDDDLIYPSNYVEVMTEWVEKTQSIVTCHGRILKPGRKFYYGSDHECFDFRHEIKQPYVLDVAGTGCSAFRTDLFKPDIALSPYKRMSDLVFSLEAARQGQKIVLIPKKRDWITQQEVKSSIFGTESRGDQREQIELMNKILECKGL